MQLLRFFVVAILQVPVSLGYQDGNLTADEASTLDTFCSKNALEFLKFGLEDPRVVGLFPFHYNGGIVVGASCPFQIRSYSFV